MACRSVTFLLSHSLWAVTILAGPLWCQAGQCCPPTSDSDTTETRCSRCCPRETGTPVQPRPCQDRSGGCCCQCPGAVILFDDVDAPGREWTSRYLDLVSVESKASLLERSLPPGDALTGRGTVGCLLCYQHMAVLR